MKNSHTSLSLQIIVRVFLKREAIPSDELVARPPDRRGRSSRSLYAFQVCNISFHGPLLEYNILGIIKFSMNPIRQCLIKEMNKFDLIEQAIGA